MQLPVDDLQTETNRKRRKLERERGLERPQPSEYAFLFAFISFLTLLQSDVFLLPPTDRHLLPSTPNTPGASTLDTMAEYLISETDRLVTGILDASEIVSSQHRTAHCNHIFMNFVYNLPVEYEDVLAAREAALAFARSCLRNSHST